MNEIKVFTMFAIQLDELTDVASCSQLLVVVRYVHMEDVKEEFLHCNALETVATAQDVVDNISNFFVTEGLLGKSSVAYVQMEHRRCLDRNRISK